MAIIDIFKKKKKKEKIEKKEAIKKPLEGEMEKKKKVKKPEIKKLSEKASIILKEPHITEKATSLAQVNQYVFKIYPKVNKDEIKKAIEKLYGVNVISVNVINVPGKKKRLGRIEGFRKGYKKAIVKIKKGQKIEVMPK